MMGVEVDRVVMTAFFIGGALAGACGMIFGLYYNLAKVDMGFGAGLRAFTAAVLGGIGNLAGAMLGGFLIGLVESMTTQFISDQWSNVVVFSVLVLVLIFRPSGLLGESVPSKV
jgi:branched-chain amino acid transport system permease protein